MDRDRARLDRRRVRPPAVVDQRGAADPPRGVVGDHGAGVVQPVRLRDLLHGAARGRALPDAEVRAPRAVVPPHGALPPRERVGPLKGAGDLRLRLCDAEADLVALRGACCSSGFAIMDGMDLGIGTLLPFVGRTDDERRVFSTPSARHWEGNQVWFITAGGATFAAWPLVYATAFLGVLRCADPDAVRALLAPGRLRLPQQGARPALAQRVGLGHLRRRHGPGHRLRRRLRQSASRRTVPFRFGPAHCSTRDRSSVC